MKILIADDSPVIRTTLLRLLQKWGHDVLAAGDGEEAWEILQNEKVGFVVSDWMMPKMDGVELCRKIRAANWSHYVYFILLTAKDGKEDLVKGMECGADDFLSKPFDRGELDVRIHAGARILELESSLEKRNEELTEANNELVSAYDRIAKDLEATAEMQRNLLPSAVTELPGVRFGWLFSPSMYVGGDIFNFFMLDDHHLAFYHLDVSGHGVPSAMLSVTVSKILSPEMSEGSFLKVPSDEPPGYTITSPSEVVRELNRRFQNKGDAMLYFTMVYGVLNTNTGHLRMTQAGHPNPIHINRADGPSLLGDGGYPVGMIEDVEFEESETYLQKGDRLVLYSDGITECKNDERVEYGEDRFMDLIAKDLGAPLDSLTTNLESDLRDWRGSDKYDDDISLLAIERAK